MSKNLLLLLLHFLLVLISTEKDVQSSVVQSLWIQFYSILFILIKLFYGI